MNKLTGSQTLCPKCGKVFKVEISECPKCGHVLTNEERIAGTKRGNRNLIGCLGVVAIALIIYLLWPQTDISKQDTSTVQGIVVPSAKLPNFEVVEQQKLGTIKMSMVMFLQQPADENTLTALAKQIYADYNGKKYERVFMEWYLPGMQRGAGAWAVTHYDTGWDIKILE